MTGKGGEECGEGGRMTGKGGEECGEGGRMTGKGGEEIYSVGKEQWGLWGYHSSGSVL